MISFLMSGSSNNLSILKEKWLLVCALLHYIYTEKKSALVVIEVLPIIDSQGEAPHT